MTKRFVSLAMYAPPPEALAGFWRGLRRHIVRAGIEDVAEELGPSGRPEEYWTSPDLLLAQTCGYPLTHALKDRVLLVGTPCYSAPDCAGPLYSSVILVRESDVAETLGHLAGRRAAFNARDSQSGYNALRAAVAPLARGGRFFGETIETGAHRASMAALVDGRADVAAVDCVTFALAGTHGQAGLRVLARTQPVPGLPLITATGTSDGELSALRSAFAAACADRDLSDEREAMLLGGFDVLALDDYAALVDMEANARGLGYPELA